MARLGADVIRPVCERCNEHDDTVEDRTSLDAPQGYGPFYLCDACAEYEAQEQAEAAAAGWPLPKPLTGGNVP